MTREEAKDKMLTESVQYKNGLKTVALRKINNFIDQIFDYFGEKLQDKDDEIELLKHRVEEAMKPKTCEGCIDEIISSNRCEFCIRTHPQDFYVAKDNA